jgi:hypothetical protein
MESTSDELIDLLKLKKFDQLTIHELEQILVAADLVKFAKGQPLQQDIDLHMEYASHFILNSHEPTSTPPPAI